MIRVGAVLHCMASLTCFTPTAIKRRRLGALESDWRSRPNSTICGRPAVPTGTIRSNQQAAAEFLSRCLPRSVPLLKECQERYSALTSYDILQLSFRASATDLLNAKFLSESNTDR